MHANTRAKSNPRRRVPPRSERTSDQPPVHADDVDLLLDKELPEAVEMLQKLLPNRNGLLLQRRGDSMNR